MLNKLKTQAQRKQFGAFLSELDINIINKDYYHILNTHINHGDKNTIKNALRFFENVVHYEDSPDEIIKCRSVKRRDDRNQQLNAEHKTRDSENDNENNKNIWELKEHYKQSQLDVIHSYLVHSKWQYFVQRYSTKHELNIQIYQPQNNVQNVNTEKYVTELDDSASGTYGFGVDFSHPYLSPVYASVYDELLCNRLRCLSENQFQNLITKSIKLHQIALSTEYKTELICKYYNELFNIIRNESIGLRHILVLVTYTDISEFCTIFRQTYRKIQNETTEKEVTQRHLQLYYYSRCLFEAIEFFGRYMGVDFKVYHGLNKVMKFEKFTAYFNQPVSTTTSINTAVQFANGRGIVLTLKAAVEYSDDISKTPKYLAVSWMSCFPNEDERLFYGGHVAFKIHNITEAETLKGHTKELLMLNKFQKIVQNQDVFWGDKNKKQIEALAILIEQHNHPNVKDGKTSSLITQYGQELFNYFCDNENTTEIVIRNYKILPTILLHALFNTDKSHKKLISLDPIIQLFKNVKEIVLNELHVSQMTVDGKQYANIVIDFINSQTTAPKLEKITLKSESQRDKKTNPTLKNLEKEFSQMLKEHQWGIKYQFRVDNTHNLIFSNHSIHREMFVPYSSNEIIQSIDDVIAVKQQTIPSYFMQITSVDEDDFHIEVIADKVMDEKRKFFVREFTNDTQNKVVLDRQKIVIKKKKKMAGIDIIIYDEHDHEQNKVVLDRQKIVIKKKKKMAGIDIIIYDEHDHEQNKVVLDRQNIVIKKKKKMAGRDIIIDDEHDHVYNLVLYEDK
eukprot:194021_1